MDSKTLQTLRRDAEDICRSAIEASVPDAAIQRALAQLPPCQGRTVRGLHRQSRVADRKSRLRRAGQHHRTRRGGDEIGPQPRPHRRSAFTRRAIPCRMTFRPGHGSGAGGSQRPQRKGPGAVSGVRRRLCLFERPLVPLAELEDLTGQMLACGADITQINTIRKRLSGVKGGRFAQLCAPAHVYAILLSDVIGDPPDMIASGPAYPDSTTTAQAMALVSRYGLTLSPRRWTCWSRNRPRCWITSPRSSPAAWPSSAGTRRPVRKHWATGPAF